MAILVGAGFKPAPTVRIQYLHSEIGLLPKAALCLRGCISFRPIECNNGC